MNTSWISPSIQILTAIKEHDILFRLFAYIQMSRLKVKKRYTESEQYE